jgi:hypothetical protein
MILICRQSLSKRILHILLDENIQASSNRDVTDDITIDLTTITKRNIKFPWHFGCEIENDLKFMHLW